MTWAANACKNASAKSKCASGNVNAHGDEEAATVAGAKAGVGSDVISAAASRAQPHADAHSAHHAALRRPRLSTPARHTDDALQDSPRAEGDSRPTMLCAASSS